MIAVFNNKTLIISWSKSHLAFSVYFKKSAMHWQLSKSNFRRLFSCRYCRALPAFMNNTMNQSNSATEIFQVSKCLKNMAFFRMFNPEESDPWISISVCMIKTLMTEELITSLGWGPCIFVCSFTVNAAVSTQTQTTPQTCLSSQAVCNHQV